MSVATVPVQQATIRQYAKQLQLSTVGGQFLSMAEEAVKQKQGHLSYLEALLGAEVEDRYQHAVARRIKDAHFPKVKTLEDFAFSDAPHLPGKRKEGLTLSAACRIIREEFQRQHPEDAASRTSAENCWWVLFASRN